MSMLDITALRPDPASLQVEWSDGHTSRYPWIWLRDHAHDAETLHPVTQQRQLFTAGLPDTLTPTTVELDTANEVASGGAAVVIGWAHDDAPTVLPVVFLIRYRHPHPARAAVDVTPVLWDAGTLDRAPTVAYADVIASDDGLRDWLGATTRFGFCLAVGTPATAEATEHLLRRVGYVRETIFGGMWEFTADLTKADTAYTNLELRPHTDGTYSHDAPGVQLLHCLEFVGTGGESTMVDAFAAAERLRSEHPDHYRTLSTVVVPGQYIGDGSHLIAARPILRHDHTGALVQVSFNNYDRAPFLLPETETLAFYAALRAFDQIVNDPAMQWRHVLAPGEAMLFDNWRVLHGRCAYSGLRRMCGGYVNREDVESRLRQLL
ncbi:MAG: Trimethyllysine dioxygenase [Ilumatobacteraceae bacterium]|nr:Trimethyllysine dioxygenase [Ilumatobacteraceae bacterium]MCU1387006.1 Trimethyllysine dioxygenase [Ilumatobacteraceae bacterium]